MLILHTLRLSESDAICLNFGVDACKAIARPELKARADVALQAWVTSLLARRLSARDVKMPPLWRWHHEGRTLFITHP